MITFAESLVCECKQDRYINVALQIVQLSLETNMKSPHRNTCLSVFNWQDFRFVASMNIYF